MILILSGADVHTQTFRGRYVTFAVRVMLCSCGSVVVEHCVSNAKGCGFNSQGTHILTKKKYSLNALDKLWIKASDKCKCYRFFSGIFPSKIKFNHSVLGSAGGRLWRLLCSLVHPKTQHL